MPHLRKSLLFVCFAGAALLAACGGGGGGSSSATLPVTSTTTSPTPNATPGATLGTQGSAVAIPTTAGYSGYMVLPAGSGTVSVSVSASAPAGAAPLSKRMQASANTGLLYATLTATSAVTLDGVPGFQVYVPSTITGNVYVAELSGAAWSTIGGPFTIANGFFVMPSASGTLTLQSGQSLQFAIYQGGPIATPTPAPVAAGTYLYEYDASSHSINAFSTTASGAATPSYQVTVAATPYINGLAVDASGTIYALDESDSAIYVFAPDAVGSATPVRTISGSQTQLSVFLNALAVGSDGTIYVAQGGLYASTPSVLAFAPGASGNVAPVRTIDGTVASNTSGTIPADATAVAFDQSGNLVVSMKPRGGYGLGAFDTDVYPANANGSAPPTHAANTGCFALSGCAGLVVTQSELYCATGNGNISVFDAALSSATPTALATITDAADISDAIGLATDGSNLYVANAGVNSGAKAIVTFPLSASGTSVPTRTITLTSPPTALAEGTQPQGH